MIPGSLLATELYRQLCRQLCSCHRLPPPAACTPNPKSMPAWPGHSQGYPGLFPQATQTPSSGAVQVEMLRVWSRSVLRGFSNCVGGCPQVKLQRVVDQQLRLLAREGVQASWSSLFGNLTGPMALASEGGFASQQQLQVRLRCGCTLTL